jgi:outer membrane lipoprotein-sorting protein
MKKIKLLKVTFLIAVIAAYIGLNKGVAADDWKDIYSRIKKKYTNFEKEVKDIKLMQETNADYKKGNLTTKMDVMKKGVKFRVDALMNMPGMDKEMKSTIIYDGKDTWMMSALMGKQKITGDIQSQYQPEKDWWGLLSKNAKVKGIEVIDKRKCYVIEFEKDSPFERLWLDQENLVLIKGESEITQGQNMMWIYSDFKKIKDEWEFPYKTKIFVNDQLVSDVVIKSLEINTGLRDELFDPDKIEIEKLDMDEMMNLLEPNKQ